VSITDGPYAETKEQLGGGRNLDIEAKDLNHAIQLMSKHRAVKADRSRFARSDLTEMIRESERRVKNK